MEPVSRQTAPVLEKTYQFVLWLVPTVDKFPRAQKFLLGDRIQSSALDVLEGLVEAAYTKARGPILARVNLGLMYSARAVVRELMDDLDGAIADYNLAIAI